MGTDIVGGAGEKQILPLRERMTSRGGVPWYVWVGVAAVTCAYLGGEWDVAWHRSIGADTFWSPPHLLIYACAVMAGVVSLWLVVSGAAGGVRFWGMRGPLGVFCAGWGGAAMLMAAPLDKWWHAAYGLDVKMVSPPHVLLIVGIRAIAAGMVLVLVAAMNGAEGSERARFRRLLVWVGGVAVASQMYFVQEYTLDTMLHRASAYVVVAAALPVVLCALSEVAGGGGFARWVCTWAAGLYMAMVIVEILVLPLCPAHPRLGPVMFPVSHLVPAKFPLLLVPAAVGVDFVLQRVRGLAARAVAAGCVFVGLLSACEWPFADFLMSPASRNRVFGTGYFGYLAEPGGFARMHVLFFPQHGVVLALGLGDGRTFGTRNLIVFLAFSVILVTLVLQGLTLPPLIRLLGLSKPGDEDAEERAARRAVLECAVDHLEKGRVKDGETFAHVYDDLLHRYRHRLAAVGAGLEDNEEGLDAKTYARLREIARGAVQAERRTLLRLREDGSISDDTLRTLEREMDLTESRYEVIAEP